MDDFRMKLDPVKRTVCMTHHSKFGIVSPGDLHKSFREAFDFISMAHPNGAVIGQPSQDRVIGVGDPEPGRSELSFISLDDFSSQGVGHELHAVTDPENRNLQRKDPAVATRPLIDHGRWASGQDNSHGVHGFDPFQGEIERMNLAIDMFFPDAPGDELGILGTEVQYKQR